MFCLPEQLHMQNIYMENSIINEMLAPTCKNEGERHTSFSETFLKGSSRRCKTKAKPTESWDTSTSSYLEDELYMIEIPIKTPEAKVKTGNSKKRPRNESISAGCSKWKSWKQIEEVFLVGAVMERFFRRGSMSSSKGNGDCWLFIKEQYDLAWEKYEGMTNICAPLKRSQQALSRHYKVMKSKLAEKYVSGDDSNNNDAITFRDYYYEWEHYYNRRNRLLGKRRKCTNTIP